MGRIEPVECIEVSQQRNGNVLNVKPPAMRARDVCYTKAKQTNSYVVILYNESSCWIHSSTILFLTVEKNRIATMLP